VGGAPLPIELAPLDLEPTRAILESHGLGDAISPGSPDAATVEREVGKLRAQIAATRDRALAELARGTPRPDYERFKLERALGVAA
jgi:hypothetical protein